MNLLLRAAAAAALLLPLAVAPATAQNYRGAFGVYGGGLWSSDFNRGADEDFIGFDFDNDGDIDDVNFIGARDLRLEPGWIAGAQGDYWFGNGRFGVRLNGAYTERSLQLRGGFFQFDENGNFILDENGNLILSENDDERVNFADINTWFADGDLMVRFLTPRRDRTFAPFASAGLGVVVYNPAGDADIVTPEANSVFDNASTRFAGAFGLGTDVLPGWNIGSFPIGLRLEVVDHIAFQSPASRITDGDRYGAVHHVRFTAGVQTLFGELFPPAPVAVLPPPAAPAPPAPAEETVMVCVVNPTAPGGLSMVNAIYVPSTRDTMVMINGERVRLETAVRGIPTAPQADWFVRGAPLTINAGGMQNEFVTYGGTRIIEPSDLAYLGTVNGLPVYTGMDEVSNTALANIQPGADLMNVLATQPSARQAFEEVEVLYVPSQATGCVFQPLRRVEVVRKVRG